MTTAPFRQQRQQIHHIKNYSKEFYMLLKIYALGLSQEQLSSDHRKSTLILTEMSLPLNTLFCLENNKLDRGTITLMLLKSS